MGTESTLDQLQKIINQRLDDILKHSEEWGNLNAVEMQLLLLAELRFPEMVTKHPQYVRASWLKYKHETHREKTVTINLHKGFIVEMFKDFLLHLDEQNGDTYSTMTKMKSRSGATWNKHGLYRFSKFIHSWVIELQEDDSGLWKAQVRDTWGRNWTQMFFDLKPTKDVDTLMIEVEMCLKAAFKLCLDSVKE